jgi:hypothetical protein
MDAPLCLHCERAPYSADPQVRALRLCERCGAQRGLRRIYRRRRGWTPAWDAHLQRLVERARLGLPVADSDPSYTIPNPPGHRRQRRRVPQVYRLTIRFGP